MGKSRSVIVNQQQKTTADLLNQLDALDAAINTFFNRAESALTQAYTTKEATEDLDRIESLAQDLDAKFQEAGLSSLTQVPSEPGDKVDVHEMAGQLNDRVRSVYEARQNLQSCVRVAAQL